MGKVDEIKVEIWRIWEILILVKECFHYSFYLYKPNTQRELEYINRSHDLDFIRHILWRTTVIEISKLFSESENRDRYNIKHFIRKLRRDGYFGDVNVQQIIIDKWEEQINQSKTTIDKLLKLRDKVYAHSDAKKDEYLKNDVTFEDTKRLIEIVENVFKEIYGTVFESDVMMETVIFDRNGFNLIRILADAKEREINEILTRGELGNNPNT